MGFSRQEYWSGLTFPSPGDIPDPRIKPGSPALQAYSLPTELRGKPKNICNSVEIHVSKLLVHADVSGVGCRACCYYKTLYGPTLFS